MFRDEWLTLAFEVVMLFYLEARLPSAEDCRDSHKCAQKSVEYLQEVGRLTGGYQSELAYARMASVKKQEDFWHAADHFQRSLWLQQRQVVNGSYRVVEEVSVEAKIHWLRELIELLR